MPLRLLHTADWHLGQSFHGYDRDYEHARFLSWLLATLATERPDALLLAGDVFDTVNPSATAQRRFYDFLATAHATLPGLQIVITAGNHDAAARLEAPAGLLEAFHITVVGTVPRDAEGHIQAERLVVPLKNAAGQVEALAVAVPFLRPADVPVLADAADPYLDGIKELYRLATNAAEHLRDTAHPGAALIALGHCHLNGADESRDSERRLIIGGAESLRADTFPASLAYVALGHLHKPQAIDAGRIRYSGSPLPLSFSEKDYAHQVLLLRLDAGRLTSVTPIAVPRTAALLRVPGRGAAPLEEILTQLNLLAFDPSLAPEQYPFVEVHVLDDGPDPKRRHRIETALLGKPVRLTGIKLSAPDLPAPTEPGTNTPPTATADLRSIEPEQLLTEAYQEKYRADPAPALIAALREILLAETTAPHDGP